MISDVEYGLESMVQIITLQKICFRQIINNPFKLLAALDDHLSMCLMIYFSIEIFTTELSSFDI